MTTNSNRYQKQWLNDASEGYYSINIPSASAFLITAENHNFNINLNRDLLISRFSKIIQYSQTGCWIVAKRCSKNPEAILRHRGYWHTLDHNTTSKFDDLHEKLEISVKSQEGLCFYIAARCDTNALLHHTGFFDGYLSPTVLVLADNSKLISQVVNQWSQTQGEFPNTILNICFNAGLVSVITLGAFDDPEVNLLVVGLQNQLELLYESF